MLGCATETDVGNLSRIERCERRPSLDVLEAIVHALTSQVLALYQSIEVKESGKHYHSLTNEDRALAVTLIGILKKP